MYRMKSPSRHASLSLLAGAVAVLGLSACSGDDVEEVRIGFVYPLSGTNQAVGESMRAAAQLAIDLANEGHPEINLDLAHNSGIRSLDGAKLVAFFEDSAGDPATGSAAATRLINEQRVHFIVGSYNSNVTEAVSTVCENAGIPMLNPESTAPGLTARSYKWFWRTTPHDTFFVKDVFDFMQGLTQGKSPNLAAVNKADIAHLAAACENSTWGAATCSLIDSNATTYDYSLDSTQTYDRAASPLNLDTQVAAMISSGASVFMFASYEPDAIIAINTLKAQHAAPRLVWGNDSGFDGSTFRSTLGADLRGVLTRTVFLPKVGDKKGIAKQINDLYKGRTGSDLNGSTARTFTGVQAVVHILEKAASREPGDLQAAANTVYIPGDQLILPWQGIKFSSSADDLGQNIMGVGIIAQYQVIGASVDMQIVYPFEYATANLIYPFPAY